MTQVTANINTTNSTGSNYLKHFLFHSHDNHITPTTTTKSYKTTHPTSKHPTSPPNPKIPHPTTNTTTKRTTNQNHPTFANREGCKWFSNFEPLWSKFPSLSRTYFEGILPENIFKHENSQNYQREEGQNANEEIFPVTTGKVN